MSRLLRNDEGFAMVAVMGVVALVTVVAVGGYWVASTTLSESQRIEHESKAFQVAQSGLDRELAAFDPSALLGGVYTNTGSTPDGTYSINASQTSIFEYRMTSLGTAQGRSETVTQRFYYFSLWDMNIGAGQSTPMGGGRGFNGNASIDGPLYVKGDFDFENGNGIYEGGPLMIKSGDVLAGGSATIGYAQPIDLFCDGSIGGSKPSNIYYKTWSTSVPDIQLPWIVEEDLDDRMQAAIDQSVDNEMGYLHTANIEADAGNSTTYDDGSTIAGRSKAPGASDYYKYVGPAGGHSSLNSGSTDLTIGSTSFGAWEGNGYAMGSGMHDDFAFDAGTGTLYVEGTVFIDGDLEMGSNVRSYRGNGTLVVNGDVHLDGVDLQPVGGSMSKENCLGIMNTGDFRLEGPGNFEGAIFSNGEFSLYHTHTRFEGSVLCDTLYGDKPNVHLQTNPILPSIIPEGMPAIGGQIYKGTWTRN
jgi:hypothetical protein